MNTEQTRQLGIEFERRIQTMLPYREFLDKLDTETIYSFLNQYQDKYIHELFLSLDKLSEEELRSIRIETILKNLLMTEVLTQKLSSDEITDTFKLPSNFSMYVKSASFVDQFYRFKRSNNIESDKQQVANEFVQHIKLSDYIENPNDILRILRNPIVTIAGGNLKLIHDRYTHVTKVQLSYYKTPKYFSPLTGINCELPIDMFDDLVTGAVQLYVQYASATNQKEQKQNDKNND